VILPSSADPARSHLDRVPHDAVEVSSERGKVRARARVRKL
jgi:hypothetical protein